jgi:hypothetical protein
MLHTVLVLKDIAHSETYDGGFELVGWLEAEGMWKEIRSPDCEAYKDVCEDGW